MKTGILFRLGSLWVGAHYSKHNKRLCVNLFPCITFWITWPKETKGIGFATELENKIVRYRQRETD